MIRITGFISETRYLLENTRFEVTLAEIVFGVLIVVAITLASLFIYKFVKTIGRHIEKQKQIDIRLGHTMLNIQAALAQQFPVQAEHTAIRDKRTANIVAGEKIMIPESIQQPEVQSPLSENPGDEQPAPNALPVDKNQPVKVKKNRAMSMEERWAEFESRRAAERTLHVDAVGKRKRKTA